MEFILLFLLLIFFRFYLIAKHNISATKIRIQWASPSPILIFQSFTLLVTAILQIVCIYFKFTISFYVKFTNVDVIVIFISQEMTRPVYV